MVKRTVVVKLGGSVITDKKVDRFYRGEVVRELGRCIAESRERVVVVHGGGSFGHVVAKRHGLSGSYARRSPDGVGETRLAMHELDALVCDSLLAGGVKPYAFSPFPLLTAAGKKGIAWLDRLLEAGLTPVTFGDVVLEKDGFTIVSGDTISRLLSHYLDASRCIFAMNVDGVLDQGGKVIQTLESSDVRRLSGKLSSDATGGIALKVREAMKIARAGTEVAFVSGFKPAEFSKALKRLSFHGTIVKVPSRD
jgi:isopentenyl phosphate kinase